LKVTFTTVQDCENLRRELAPRIQKNKKKVSSFVSEAMQESGDIAIQDTFHNSSTYSSKTFIGFRQMLQNYLDEDPFFLAEDILEHDVPLVSRVCIDMNIRCGKWYDITIHPHEQPQVIFCEFNLT
jgi:DNA polymerase elongation subunit (family B)